MTLIVAVAGKESIWLAADRRLTYANGKTRDNARKFMFLETKDGKAIVGYAGLGATAQDTEPSDWMASVLRGRKLPLEDCLSVLAEAMQKQFRKHLNFYIPGHCMLIPAIVDGESRLYAMVAKRTNSNPCEVRWVREEVSQYGSVCRAGSGMTYTDKDDWMEYILGRIRGCENGELSPFELAEDLADLNFTVHDLMKEKTVGPTSIVAWRFLKRPPKHMMGGHSFYSGSKRVGEDAIIPCIGTGDHVSETAQVIGRRLLEQLRAGIPPDKIDPQNDKVLKARLDRMPKVPDENLR